MRRIACASWLVLGLGATACSSQAGGTAPPPIIASQAPLPRISLPRSSAGPTSPARTSATPATRAAPTAPSLPAIPQPCVAGTCWVVVNVATLWVEPWYPRPVDRPILGNPADPGAWVGAMTFEQMLWLVGKLQTQALYGTRVMVIGHDGAAWTEVAVPSQPTNLDARGYPGWVPTAQLTSTPPPETVTSAIVQTPTAWLWSAWSPRGVRGSRLIELSIRDPDAGRSSNRVLCRGGADRRHEGGAECK